MMIYKGFRSTSSKICMKNRLHKLAGGMLARRMTFLALLTAVNLGGFSNKHLLNLPKYFSEQPELNLFSRDADILQ